MFGLIYLSQCLLFLQASATTVDDRLEQIRQSILEELTAKTERSFVFLTSERHLYDLLRFRAIRSELNIDIKTHREIERIKSETERKVTELYSSDEYKSPPMLIVRSQTEQDMRARALDAMRRLLNERQLQRLHQVAYYCEIDYLGLDVALTGGRFGVSVGVNENQKTHLSVVAKKVAEQERTAIWAMNLQLHEKIIELLRPAERVVAEELLGPYFDIYDDEWQFVREHRADLFDEIARDFRGATSVERQIVNEAELRGIAIAPDGTAFSTKYNMLFKKRCQVALALTSEQLRAITATGYTFKEFSAHERERFLKRELVRIDEILSPEQQTRLAQLGNYLAIASQGYAKFFTDGNFAQKVEMSGERSALLTTEIESLERVSRSNCIRIKEESLVRVLEQLSSSQRTIAKKALGEFFYCPEYLFGYRRNVQRER